MTPNKDSTIRVLHVLANLNLGGAEARMMDIFRTQAESDVRNDFVIMTDEHCHFTDEILAAGGTIHIIENPRHNILIALWQLFKLLKRAPKYQAVHAHTSYFSGMVVFLAALAGIKKRVTHARTKSMGHLDSSPGVTFKLGQLLCRYFATTRFAVSEDAGKFLYNSSRFTVVADAFDFRSIAYHRDTRRTELREQYQLSDSFIHVVSVARFSIVKNHVFMVKLAEYCRQQNQPIYFHFVGDGAERPAIEQLVNELKLDKRVRFWGKRNDVSSLLTLFDVMIMPSIFEGLGVAALESQAAGVPCVMSTGIPQEADIGIGLGQFVNLDSEMAQWLNAITVASQQEIPDKNTINEQFCRRGYELASTREIFREAYL